MEHSESQTIARLIADVLAAGHVLSVCDGEAFPVKRSSDAAVILGAMASTDEDSLIIRRATGERIGAVSLVYGNEPGVVISDHTDSPEMGALLAGAFAVAKTFER